MHKRYLFFLLLLSIFSSRATAVTAKTLAIIPFTVHAAEDMAYLADGTANMLATRIAAGTGVSLIDPARVRARTADVDRPLNRAAALDIGRALNADYVLFGSITRLGDQFSLDAETIDVSGTRAPVAVYEQAPSANAVIPAVNTLAAKIVQRVFSGSSPPPLTPATPAPAASRYAHPEKLLDNQPQAATETITPPPGAVNPPAGAQTAGPASPFIQSTTNTAASPGFWKSRDLEMEACGLSVADVTGDGQMETLILANDRLIVRKLADQRFFKLAERPSARHEKFFTVDAADTDGNGKAEIFITALTNHTDRLCSQVLEFAGSGENLKLVPVAEKQNWYFRRLDATTICGQKKGLSDLFLPGIWRLTRSGNNYIQTDPIELPGDLTVFALNQGDILNNGSPETIVADANDKLRIYDSDGQLIWKSDDRFGGSETYLDGPEPGDDDAVGKRTYIAQRVLVADLNQDGRSEVLTVTNQEVAGRLFQRFRQYGGATFACLVWDGLGLAEKWKTRKISGYAADFALGDMDNDGQMELAAVMVRQRDGVLTSPRSCVIKYDLNLTP